MDNAIGRQHRISTRPNDKSDSLVFVEFVRIEELTNDTLCTLRDVNLTAGTLEIRLM
jgi:hypothetical protein